MGSTGTSGRRAGHNEAARGDHVVVAVVVHVADLDVAIPLLHGDDVVIDIDAWAEGLGDDCLDFGVGQHRVTGVDPLAQLIVRIRVAPVGQSGSGQTGGVMEIPDCALGAGDDVQSAVAVDVADRHVGQVPHVAFAVEREAGVADESRQRVRITEQNLNDGLLVAVADHGVDFAVAVEVDAVRGARQDVAVGDEVGAVEIVQQVGNSRNCGAIGEGAGLDEFLRERRAAAGVAAGAFAFGSCPAAAKPLGYVLRLAGEEEARQSDKQRGRGSARKVAKHWVTPCAAGRSITGRSVRSLIGSAD